MFKKAEVIAMIRKIADDLESDKIVDFNLSLSNSSFSITYNYNHTQYTVSKKKVGTTLDMKGLSKHEKLKIVAAHLKSGMSQKEIIEVTGLSQSSVSAYTVLIKSDRNNRYDWEASDE